MRSSAVAHSRRQPSAGVREYDIYNFHSESPFLVELFFHCFYCLPSICSYAVCESQYSCQLPLLCFVLLVSTAALCSCSTFAKFTLCTPRNISSQSSQLAIEKFGIFISINIFQSFVSSGLIQRISSRSMFN